MHGPWAGLDLDRGTLAAVRRRERERQLRGLEVVAPAADEAKPELARHGLRAWEFVLLQNFANMWPQSLLMFAKKLS